MLKPADQLSVLFISLLCVLVVCAAATIPSWERLLTTYVLLLLSILMLARYRSRILREKYGFYAHVGLIVVTISSVFNSLGDLIHGLRSRTYDDVLINIDFALFGVHPTVWLERLINPALTAVLQFAYISYYLIPISLGVVLISKGRYAMFEEALFGIVLCFYLSYIGYLLVPAIGPRFTLNHLQAVDMQAVPFVKTIQETLNGLEQNKTDAFPSGRTAVALVTLFYAWI